MVGVLILIFFLEREREQRNASIHQPLTAESFQCLQNPPFDYVIKRRNSYWRI
jgi:hypothetical protein